jgi:hypothetical protein
MAVGGMPVRLQVMGQRKEDARVAAIARRLLERIEPVEGKLQRRHERQPNFDLRTA